MTHPNVYLSDAELINTSPEDLGIERRSYCPSAQSKCMQYLYAKAYQQEEFSAGSNVYYNVHTSGNGIENSISYSAESSQFNRYKGTAVLLHGYGGSKEAMMVTSIYFRSIGMNIIALDLFGHGESEYDFSFAAKEHELYTKLIADVASSNKLSQPIILVGHSMGALAAANTLLSSSDADGAILLAPMIRFDLAAKHYLAYKNTTLNSMLSEHLDGIVSKALQDQKVTLAETDISHKIANVGKPVLIINSNVDSVSPSEFFSNIENEYVELEIFDNRSHPSLITFGDKDVELIEGWLTTRLGAKIRN
jgi:pimeloyl-ACP methyl ester carboxylesterase